MTTSEISAPARRASLWRNRDFMLLWSGQAVSAIGSEASLLAYPLLALALALTGWLLQTFGPITTTLALTVPQLALAIATTLNKHVRNAPAAPGR